MKRLLLIYLLTSWLCKSVDAQEWRADQMKFLSQNLVSLKVDENYQNGNWTPVLKHIGNKRLVLLGEFNHGSRQIFLSRNELIQKLHEKLGFDLILFESGLGEMEVINLNKKELNYTQLTAGFFGIWRTKEFESLMGYIKKENIQVSGFDVQRSGETFTQYLSEIVPDKKELLDAEADFNLLKSNLANYRTVYDSVSSATSQLINFYKGIIYQLNVQDEFSRRALCNRITFLTYMLDFTQTKDWNKRWMERDAAMADNINWLLTKRYPNQKAIIIAHNYHIARHNATEQVMGEFLQKEFGQEMFVIGAFAKEGTFANNTGEPEPLSPPDESYLDIKHVISVDQSRMSFLNIPKHIPKAGRWLKSDIIVNDTFIDLSGSNKLILSKCFDGLLFLDAVTPPEK